MTNKHSNVKECPVCHAGVTSARKRLSDLVSLIMLSGSDSLDGKNHPYFNEMKGFITDSNPGKEMAELTAGLADRSPNRLLGHDSMDGWNAVRKIIEAAGLDPDTWGICKACGGSGEKGE